MAVLATDVARVEAEKSQIVECAKLYIEQIGGELDDERKRGLLAMTLDELRSYDREIRLVTVRKQAMQVTVKAIVESRHLRENPPIRDDGTGPAQVSFL